MQELNDYAIPTVDQIKQQRIGVVGQHDSEINATQVDYTDSMQKEGEEQVFAYLKELVMQESLKERSYKQNKGKENMQAEVEAKEAEDGRVVVTNGSNKDNVQAHKDNVLHAGPSCSAAPDSIHAVLPTSPPSTHDPSLSYPSPIHLSDHSANRTLNSPLNLQNLGSYNDIIPPKAFKKPPQDSFLPEPPDKADTSKSFATPTSVQSQYMLRSMRLRGTLPSPYCLIYGEDDLHLENSWLPS